MEPVTTTIVVITMFRQTLSPTATKPSVKTLPTVQTGEIRENQELSTDPVRPVAKRTNPQINAILELMQQTDRLLEIKDRWSKVKTNRKTHRSKHLEVSRLRPKLQTSNATSSLRNCM